MSIVLRLLCATFFVLLAINCSQEFSIGFGRDAAADSSLDEDVWKEEIAEDKRSDHSSGTLDARADDTKAVTTEEEDFTDSADKRNSFLRIGKRSFPDGYQTFLRIGRAPSDSTFLRIGRAGNDKGFLRIGRAPSQTFLRIGRAPGQSFLRIGRNSDNGDDEVIAEDAENDVSGADNGMNYGQDMTKRHGSFLRIGKRNLRIGKRVMNAGNRNSPELSPEELQLLLENKELLLQLLELHPGLIEDDKKKSWIGKDKEEDWSFYFPRMGRSGEEKPNTGYCCDEGVRSVVTVGQNTLKVCPPEQGCCPGLTEETKLYKDIIITECVAESGLEKIRAYIGDE